MKNDVVEDPKKLAADIGLEHCTDELVNQLAASAANARKFKMALRTSGLSYADEPALVFTVDGLFDR